MISDLERGKATVELEKTLKINGTSVYVGGIIGDTPASASFMYSPEYRRLTDTEAKNLAREGASVINNPQILLQRLDIQLSHFPRHRIFPHNIADLHDAVVILLIIPERNSRKFIAV